MHPALPAPGPGGAAGRLSILYLRCRMTSHIVVKYEDGDLLSILYLRCRLGRLRLLWPPRLVPAFNSLFEMRRVALGAVAVGGGVFQFSI